MRARRRGARLAAGPASSWPAWSSLLVYRTRAAARPELAGARDPGGRSSGVDPGRAEPGRSRSWSRGWSASRRSPVRSRRRSSPSPGCRFSFQALLLGAAWVRVRSEPPTSAEPRVRPDQPPWSVPQRRQNRAVAESDSPQLMHGWMPLAAGPAARWRRVDELPVRRGPERFDAALRRGRAAEEREAGRRPAAPGHSGWAGHCGSARPAGRGRLPGAGRPADPSAAWRRRPAASQVGGGDPPGRLLDARRLPAGSASAAAAAAPARARPARRSTGSGSAARPPVGSAALAAAASARAARLGGRRGFDDGGRLDRRARGVGLDGRLGRSRGLGARAFAARTRPARRRGSGRAGIDCRRPAVWLGGLRGRSGASSRPRPPAASASALARLGSRRRLRLGGAPRRRDARHRGRGRWRRSTGSAIAAVPGQRHEARERRRHDLAAAAISGCGQRRARQAAGLDLVPAVRAGVLPARHAEVEGLVEGVELVRRRPRGPSRCGRRPSPRPSTCRRTGRSSSGPRDRTLTPLSRTRGRADSNV